MSRCRIVAFSGNLQRPSRTRSLVEAIGSEAARRVNAELRVFDLLDAGPALAGALNRAALPLPAARLVDAIESADALVAGSPVYKGAYTGLFKHVFDLVEPDRLAGKPVAIAATGGGPRHALVVEHALRPLFGFFTALSVPTAVYATDGELARREESDGYEVADAALAKRVTEAARQLAALLNPPAAVPAQRGRLTADALWSPDR
jgi:FMN reductase